jgi:hypothetical protein
MDSTSPQTTAVIGVVSLTAWALVKYAVEARARRRDAAVCVR